MADEEIQINYNAVDQLIRGRIEDQRQLRSQVNRFESSRLPPSVAGRLEGFKKNLFGGDAEKQPLIENGDSAYYEDSSTAIVNNQSSSIYPTLHFSSDESDRELTNDDDDSSLLESSFKKMLEQQKRTSNLQTLMHIFKANIGTGILAMPHAFLNSGLYLGLISLPFLAILSTHCMHILIRANRVLTRRLGVGMLEYQEVASHSMSIGPICLRKYSYHSAQMIKIFLLITQFGFCCVYSLFVAKNLELILKDQNLLSSMDDKNSTLLLMLISLPFFILLVFIKSLKHLSVASSLANMLQTVGLVIVMYNLVEADDHQHEVEYIGKLANFPLFMGTAIYAFEGIGLVLPLQKEMQEPKSLSGFGGVLNTGMVFVASANIAIGFFGYYKFGGDVQESITLNMPGSALYQACKLMFTLAIFLSYAIQYYVPFNIIWPWFKEKCKLKEGTTRTTVYEYSLRATIVVFTFALAAAIPKLDLFISLVGALSSSALALIFPPLIDVCIRWNEDKGVKTWTYIISKDLFILLIGLIGFTTGTYASIVNIIRSYQ